MDHGLTGPLGIFRHFIGSLTVSLHSPNGRQGLPLGSCKETVKESKVQLIGKWLSSYWSPCPCDYIYWPLEGGASAATSAI